jgi:hypothetical protein
MIVKAVIHEADERGYWAKVPKVKPQRNLQAYWPFGRANGGGQDARAPRRGHPHVDSGVALV